MKEETSKAAGGEETNEIRIGNVALRARKEVPFVVFWGGSLTGADRKHWLKHLKKNKQSDLQPAHTVPPDP